MVRDTGIEPVFRRWPDQSIRSHQGNPRPPSTPTDGTWMARSL